jgi:nitrite reductase/ring-hydroxylating ferredoxin subunit
MATDLQDGGREAVSLRPLCRLDDIPDGGKGFWFGQDTARFGLFLIRQGDDVYGYENSCPHNGSPLDWLPDRFLDRGGRHILCATHGALFRIEDGFCLSGPCAGSRLRKMAIARRGAALYLDEGPNGEDGTPAPLAG